MKIKTALLISLYLIYLIVFSNNFFHAQTTQMKGSLQGVVKDQNGAAVPEALVEITEKSSNKVLATTTNS